MNAMMVIEKMTTAVIIIVNTKLVSLVFLVHLNPVQNVKKYVVMAEKI
jgi:hypothetical protein